jgi:hypothetical protein
MNALYDYRLLAQAILLGNAIFWTLAYINRVMVFMAKAIRNEGARITLSSMMYTTISWAIFFWLMKAQF